MKEMDKMSFSFVFVLIIPTFPNFIYDVINHIIVTYYELLYGYNSYVHKKQDHFLTHFMLHVYHASSINVKNNLCIINFKINLT